MMHSLKLTLITIVALCASVRHTGAQPKACGSEIRPIDVNQTTLHYFECGKGEPLVFVHGGLGYLHTFRGQVETFAAHFRVVAYSRRYHPPNIPPRTGDDNPLRVHLADLAALVTALKASPAHFVGNSYGAYIALALAVEQPHLVRSLILGEPPIGGLLSGTAMGKAAMESWSRRVIVPAQKALEGGHIDEGLRRFLDGICGTGCLDRFPQSRRTELVEKQGPAFRLEMLTDLSGYMPPLACNKLRELKQPMLLVAGERSDFVFLLITAELERCLKSPSVVMVPEAAHTPQQENTGFYNEAVMGFLQRSGLSPR